MPPLQQFRVRDKLMRILRMVGATEKLFTTKQIISFLGKYIEQKKLYDPKNMRTVNCTGDLLEDLFGVQVFTIGDFKDIWRFVCPHLIPATNKEVQENEQNCRNRQEIVDSSDSRTGKLDWQWMSQLPWWFFVEKDVKDVDNYDKDTASGSVMASSTAYVVDTEYDSDANYSTPADLDRNDEDRFSEEYEPDSDDSDTNTDATEPIESEDEPFSLIPRLVTEPSEETTTTDTTDASMDFDGPLEDHWRCLECTTVNPPTVGYCQRCWKLRKGWFSDSSIPSPGLTKSFTLPAEDFSQSFVPTLPRSSSQPNPPLCGIDVADGRSKPMNDNTSCDFKDTGTSSNSNFNELPFNPCKRKQDSTDDYKSEPASKIRNIIKVSPHSDGDASTSKSPENNILNSNVSQPPIESPDPSTIHEGSLTKREQPQYSFSVPGMCNICHNNPNDATIVHGKFAHQFCCYRCAKKLKNRGKTCPVCRQPIAFVVKNYICQM